MKVRAIVDIEYNKLFSQVYMLIRSRLNMLHTRWKQHRGKGMVLSLSVMAVCYVCEVNFFVGQVTTTRLPPIDEFQQQNSWFQPNTTSIARSPGYISTLHLLLPMMAASSASQSSRLPCRRIVDILEEAYMINVRWQQVKPFLLATHIPLIVF